MQAGTTFRSRHSMATFGEGAIVLAVVMWGFGSVFIKLSGFPGITFAFYRLWFVFVLMLAALLTTRRRLSAEVLKASLVGGVFFGVDVVLFFSAVKLTSIVDATIIGALQPALVLVVAGPWFGERVRRRDVVLTFVSIGGVALVALGSAGTPVWSLTGDALAVAALLSWTGYWLATKKARAKVNALEYMTGVMLIAAIVVTPILLLSGEPLAASSASDWLWLGLFVLLPAAAGQLLVAWAQRYVEVWLSSLLSLGMPVIASIAALLFLGESLPPLAVAGGLVMIAATGAIVARRAPHQIEAEDLPEGPPL